MRPEEEDRRGEAMAVTEAVSPGIRMPLFINSSLLVLIEIFLSRPETSKFTTMHQISDLRESHEYIQKQGCGERIFRRHRRRYYLVITRLPTYIETIHRVLDFAQI